MLYNHAHGGVYDLGKNELVASNSYMQRPPYAQALAERGVCALCIDTGPSASGPAARRARSSRRCSGTARSCGA